MIKLKALLVEGAYDKVVGDVNRAVFIKVKDALKGAGTAEKPKKYKGYEIFKDPIPGQNLQDLFADEDRTIYIGEFETQDGTFEVELKLAVSVDEVEPGKFFIDGGADDDEDFPSIEIHIGFNSATDTSVFSKLQPVLRDLVRHEIEHLTHGKDSPLLKTSKLLRGDKAMRRKIRLNPEIYYKYFLLPKEVDANIHGLYSKAKTMKKPYQDVVDEYLDGLVDDGIINSKNREEIYKKWKARIPKIGGLPPLK